MKNQKTETKPAASEHSKAQSDSVQRLVMQGKLYAYETIEDFEEIVGYKVNRAFRYGWEMARTTNKMLGID